MSAIRSSSIALLIALMAAPAVAAQQRTTGPAVEGAVYDTVSGKPIPFAVISVAGTGISTLTNLAGRFRVVVNVGEVELEFRKIGFRRQSVIMTVAGNTIVPDVFLTPLPVELATIRVTAMGDDLATRIMRQAIARKNDLLSRIHDYRYDAYVKFILRDLNKDEDSTESIVLITESQTMAYWEQPDKYQETITARRQSSNLDAERNLVSVGQIVNFNKNRIDLEKYSVVSPTADDALQHYRYHILDTLEVSGRRVFRLAIEPKSDVAPLFVGMIDIADSTFDILAIEVGANDVIRFPFIENLRYRQLMHDVGDDHWMPSEIRFSAEVHFGIPIPGFPEHLSFVHSASLRNFRFDEGSPPVGFGEYLVVVDKRADDVDSTEWAERRATPLSATESGAYTRIDSLESLPPSLGAILLTGTATTLLLSNNADFFHFNRVEGAYLGAGWTWRDLSPDFILRAKTGYAFGSEEWQVRLGAQYRLSERRRLWIGATYSDQIVARPTIVSSGYNPTYLALFTKLDPLNYYHEQGFTLSLSTKVVDFTQFRLQYNDSYHRSVPVVTYYSVFNSGRLVRGNQPFDDGRLRSLSASLQYDSRPLLKQKGRDFYLNTLTYTRITLGAEVTKPSLINSDFDFRRYFVRLRRRQRTFNIGLTTIDAVAAIATGTLPAQRYFTVDFGNGVFLQDGGFNTMNERNFSGNRAAMFFVHHDFDRQLFRLSRIPLIRDLPVTLSVHGGAFWTDFVNHTRKLSDDFVLTAPTAYTELGFTIGNLTPMWAPLNFAAGFAWQLSSYDTSKFRFAIGIPSPLQ